MANLNTREPGLRTPTVAVIIVTFNSGAVLMRCIDALKSQRRRPEAVFVVDNCSSDTSYLEEVAGGAEIHVLRLPSNEGFCVGNNRGYEKASGYDYILFLNPDAFLSESFIQDALHIMENPNNSAFAALTGTLLGFDVFRGCPTGRIDSTGIFQTWYGKWYDRGQGIKCPESSVVSVDLEEVPALCGALMFCRRHALEEAVIRTTEVFDSTFFMYKEDIDLSLRLRNKGWKLGYCPRLQCFHGRGWAGRGHMSHRSRYLSARNELRVCLRNHTRGFLYSMFKFLYVRFVEIGIFHACVRLARHRKDS
jgi:GT2 family glycosyltransferase